MAADVTPAERVAVLVVHYLTPELTARAVAAVRGPAAHVYVVDNSGDLPELPDATVIRTGRNELYARGNNLAFAASDEPYVLLLNPDVELAYADLLRLRAILLEHPDAWAVAPRLVYPDGSDQGYLSRFPTVGGVATVMFPPLRRVLAASHGRMHYRDADLRRSQYVEQPAAACLLLRRDRLAGGLFDERLALFFNDADLARRQAAAGYGCYYAADVTACHVRAASLAAAGRRRPFSIGRQYNRDAWRYLAKYRMRGRWVLAPFLLGRHALLGVAGAVRARLVASKSGH